VPDWAQMSQRVRPSPSAGHDKVSRRRKPTAAAWCEAIFPLERNPRSISPDWVERSRCRALLRRAGPFAPQVTFLEFMGGWNPRMSIRPCGLQRPPSRSWGDEVAWCADAQPAVRNGLADFSILLFLFATAGLLDGGSEAFTRKQIGCRPGSTAVRAGIEYSYRLQAPPT